MNNPAQNFPVGLPVPLTPLARTQRYDQVEVKIKSTVLGNQIMAVGGPAGTGKTMAVTWTLTSLFSHRNIAYICFPPNARADDVSEVFYEGVFGRAGVGRRKDMDNAVIAEIYNRDAIVVADDADLLKLAGLQKVRYFHDQFAKRYRQRFPAFLIGVEVIDVAKTSTELNNRISRRMEFTLFNSIAEMRPAINAMHPRIAISTDAVLAKIEFAYGDGTLRQWAHISSNIPLLPSTTSKAKGLTADDVQHIGLLL